MIKIGLVAPLPPVPAGAAEYVVASLEYLEAYADVTCFVPDPSAVSPSVRTAHKVRPLAERFDESIDMLVYHLGNNRHHSFVYDAVMDGPPGIVEVHDASMHHYIQDTVLGLQGDIYKYVELGREGHGWSGQRLAELRSQRYRGVSELFLYDYLVPSLEQAIGVVVHNRYAQELVRMHRPDLHSYLVPHHAVKLPDEELNREWTGISPSTFLIANLGFVTRPKRPATNLEALRRVIDKGLDAHMVFVGRDDTDGLLRKTIKRLDLRQHVTVTGYLDTEELERWVRAVDVVVNLRAPHVGESSGSLAYSLAAGKPVVVQAIGSWAEIPSDAVVRIPVTDDDSSVLGDTLFGLGQEPGLRTAVGHRARAYARTELDPHLCAQRLVQAAATVLATHQTPPSWTTPGRLYAAREFLSNGPSRSKALLGNDAGNADELFEMLTVLTPTRSGARLLAVDVAPRYLQVLARLWGFAMKIRSSGEAGPEFKVEPAAGVPSFTVISEELSEEDFALSSAEVIILGPEIFHQSTDKPALLNKCNRALVAQGQLVILGNQGVSTQMLDLAGFSDHVFLDNPAWSKDFRMVFAHISHGTKANVPSTLLVDAV